MCILIVFHSVPPYSISQGLQKTDGTHKVGHLREFKESEGQRGGKGMATRIGGAVLSGRNWELLPS